MLGSTQYGSDFRIGQNLFSRGALMTYDLDPFIFEKNNGERSFRDAVPAFYHWTQQNDPGLCQEEVPVILSRRAGVDLTPAWEKWQSENH